MDTSPRTRMLIIATMGLLLAGVIALGIGSYLSAQSLVTEGGWVIRTQFLLKQIEEAFNLVRDAETGQRGFLLTGEIRYLDPYQKAVEDWKRLRDDLDANPKDDPFLNDNLEALKKTIDRKLEFAGQTIDLYQADHRDQALALIRTNNGQALMESVRTLENTLRTRTSQNLVRRMELSRNKALDASRLITGLGVLVLAVGSLGIALLLRSDRKLARAAGQLRGIIEGTSDVISAVDKEMRLLLFNTAFVRYHQAFNRRTPRPGMALMDVVTTLDQEHRAHVEDLYRRGLTGEEFTEVYERPFEGTVRWYILRFSPIRDARGQLIGTAQNMREITDLKEAETKFEDYARRLEESNRELTDFAFIASHDLQEPLRKILAFGERLKAKQADRFTEEGLDYLARMQNAAVRMQTLINNLLDYSRVTTKGKPPEPVNLDQVLAEVLSDLQVRIQETGARITASPLPGALGDPTQLRQLFQNLLGNALKYRHPDRPPVITVSLEKDPAGTPVLVVRDNGIGFEDRHAEKIFEVFQRLHGRGEYEGTGIGLAICRKIVTRHGGTITAEGTPGQGAAFLLKFPGPFWTAPPRRTP